MVDAPVLGTGAFGVRVRVSSRPNKTPITFCCRGFIICDCGEMRTLTEQSSVSEFERPVSRGWSVFAFVFLTQKAKHGIAVYREQVKTVSSRPPFLTKSTFNEQVEGIFICVAYVSAFES